MVQNKKGARRERELVNQIDASTDYAVMRAPASGAGTDRELPDVLCGNGTDFYAIEAKSSGGNPIYIEQREIEDLQFFATNFGADARLGVRFDYKDWYFFNPDELHETSSGNRRCKEETATTGTHFETQFGCSLE